MIKKVLIVLTLLLVLGLFYGYEDTYIIMGTVQKVDGMTTIVCDTRGHLWEYYTSDFCIGQEVKLSMCSNHTTKIADDIVKDVKPL